MNYLVVKYINLLSSQLRNFKKKADNLYNFSCPFCGDSKRNRRRARGYFLENNNECWYKCHKCGYSTHFETVLKDLNPSLFNEYLGEKLYKPKEEKKYVKVRQPAFKKAPPSFIGLAPIWALNDTTKAKQYVMQRMIPQEHWDVLYYAQQFKWFTNHQVENKFSEDSLKYEEERLVIPFFTKQKEMFGFTGRALDDRNSLRYINIVLDESMPNLYGMERWQEGEKTYVVEGPLDSLFLPNCIATSGNDMVAALRGFDKDQFVCVYDNEPRKPETKKKIAKAIESGYKVCIWPNSVMHKDINKMVLEGMSVEEILKIINSNTFQGIRAKLELVNRTNI